MSETAAWAGVVGSFVGPFVGVAGALWLYSKQRRDTELSRAEGQFEAVYVQLRAELDANRQIILNSVETIELVLGEQSRDIGSNDPIHDERVYIAPLFADSWEALAHTDVWGFKTYVPPVNPDFSPRELSFGTSHRASWRRGLAGLGPPPPRARPAPEAIARGTLPNAGPARS